MRRIAEQVLLIAVAVGCFIAASCGGTAGGYYVGYGYSRNTYDEVFYQPPIDRYGSGGFYGHP